MEDINKVFKYGDFEGILDVTDYVVVERFEKAFNACSKVLRSARQINSESQTYKKIVLTIAKVFEDTFDDENASNKILGSSTSAAEAIKALYELVDYVQGQRESVAKHWNQMMNKYSPSKRKPDDTLN